MASSGRQHKEASDDLCEQIINVFTRKDENTSQKIVSQANYKSFQWNKDLL